MSIRTLHAPQSQNEHIIDCLEKANSTSLHLAQQGFTILAVSCEKSQPEIYIEFEKRCIRFTSAIDVARTIKGQTKTLCEANYLDCKILWQPRR